MSRLNISDTDKKLVQSAIMKIRQEDHNKINAFEQEMKYYRNKYEQEYEKNLKLNVK